jgi:hypothetical protein
MADTPKKAPTDWERIELDYRAGTMTLREIGEANGVSHTAIRKRAEKEGWSRDLNAKIKAKAEELVSKAEVSKSVSKEEAETKKVTENERVMADAVRIANIKLKHRSGVQRLESLFDGAVDQVEVLVRNADALRELGELMDKGPDEKGRTDKLNEAYQKVIAIPGMVESLKKLIESGEKLFKLGRLVNGIDDGPEAPEPPNEGLAVTNETARRIAFLLSKGLRAQKD